MHHHTLVFHTIRLGKKVHKALGHKPYPFNLGSTQASAILLIWQYKEISQKEIAHHLHIEPASMVTLIDGLQNLKLVERKPNKVDRRSYLITLTQKGRKIVPDIFEITDKLDNFLRKELSSKEINYLLDVTEKLSTKLDNWKGGV